jgi:Cys-rich protein (TIGR01571 family)
MPSKPNLSLSELAQISIEASTGIASNAHKHKQTKANNQQPNNNTQSLPSPTKFRDTQAKTKTMSAGQPPSMKEALLEEGDNQSPIPGQWRDGVCGCFSDCNSLLLACCCPCFSYANSVSQTKLGNYHVNLIKYMLFVMAIGVTQQLIRGHETCVEAEDDDLSDNHYTPENCTLDGFGSAMSFIGTVAPIMLFVYVMKLRIKFRRTFGINGSCCDDCCSSSAIAVSLLRWIVT